MFETEGHVCFLELNRMKKLLSVLSIAWLLNVPFVLTTMSQGNSPQDNSPRNATRPNTREKEQPQALTPQEREKAFVSAKPTIGEALPDVSILDANGKSVQTGSFRGKYVVITFGCLT